MNLLNALQETIHYSFIKICIYCFSLWYEFFVHYDLESWKKIINMILIWDLWNWSFFGQADFSPTHSELCHFVSGPWAKHQVSSPVIILLKKMFICIGHCNNGLERCDSIFPLLRCQGVWNKTYTQISLSQILFQNLKNLGMFKDSAIILDAIWWLFLTKSVRAASSSRLWTVTSLVIFYQLHFISKSRIPRQNI